MSAHLPIIRLMDAKATHTADQELESQLEQAGRSLREGRLVVFPTETVYGIGAWALSSDGLDTLRRFKERPAEQPFTVHLPDAAAAGRYCDLSSPLLARFVKKVFPGPVTIVAEVSDELVEQKIKELGLSPDQASSIYHHNAIALRCPDHPLAQRFLGAVDGPVLASSANRRGQAPPRDADEAAKAVDDQGVIVLDGGPARYAKPSTVVRLSVREGRPVIKVEREGIYDERTLRKLLRTNILFVCSGNTCRSPMAEIVARRLLAERLGVTEEELETAGFRVSSAGAFAGEGLKASPEAVDALKEWGMDLSRHRSRPLTLEMLHESDLIFCMTRAHLEAIARIDQGAAQRAVLLDARGDVADPIGASVATYQACAQAIRQALETRLDEQGVTGPVIEG